MKQLDGLEKLPLRKRFRFIYFLPSGYVNWRKSTLRSVEVAGKAVEYWSKAIQKYPPQIEIDLQSMLDAVLNFHPSPDQQTAWSRVFSHTIQRSKAPPS